jgi:hypothetical protein
MPALPRRPGAADKGMPEEWLRVVDAVSGEGCVAM